MTILPLLNLMHHKLVIKFAMREIGSTCVIVSSDDFNLAERATANSQQLPTAFHGIIVLYAAINSRGSHAQSRRTKRRNYFTKFP